MNAPATHLTPFDNAASACPWLRGTVRGAYAADSVVRLIDSAGGFGAPLVRRLYDYRAAYHQSRIPIQSQLAPTRANARTSPSPDPDARLLGAVLHKVAVRGVPTPCSLSLERRLLYEAREAGVLNYSERDLNGSVRLDCQPYLPDLRSMMIACLIPELLLDDVAAQALLDRYRTMCSPPERELLDAVAKSVRDVRLALLMRPQREFGSLIPTLFQSESSDCGIDRADRCDFALEVPCCDDSTVGDGWIRTVVEVDDSRHTTRSARWNDRERDVALRAERWNVERLALAAHSRQQWKRHISQLVGQIDIAIPASILDAAYALRALHAHQREAITRLITLPIAEAQLLAALARMIYWGTAHAGDQIIVVDADQIGIEPAVSAVREMMRAVSAIHGIEAHTVPHVRTQGQVESPPPPNAGGFVELRYYSSPKAQAWDACALGTRQPVVVVPSCTSAECVEPLLVAEPRPILPDPELQRLTDSVDPLSHVLRNVFRKREFRSGQRAIIKRALALQPVLGLLQTGAGKSLCYQMASLLQPGTTIVVSPLRSLILDQAESLEAAGLHRVAAVLGGLGDTATEGRRARMWRARSVAHGGQILAIISPERLQMPQFDSLLKTLACRMPIPFVVVDEAHCISEWGHDFRPCYLSIERRVRQYIGRTGTIPTILALTATASRAVLQDIVRELDISGVGAIVEPHSYDRPELEIEIIQVPARRRMSVLAAQVKRLMAETGGGSGIVFSLYASAEIEVGVPRIAAELRTRLPGIEVETYTGSGRDQFIPEPEEIQSMSHLGDATPAVSSVHEFRVRRIVSRRDTEAERRRMEAQHKFRHHQVSIMVATHAFGMGLDMPDVRWVVHTLLPRSVEEYIQQIGRVGRDGQPARCILLFCDDQPALANELLDPDRTPMEDLLTKIKLIRRESRGDAVRTSWFVLSAFIGRELEKNILRHVLTEWLAPYMQPGCPAGAVVEIPFNALPTSLIPTELGRDHELILERTLYRLLMAGAITDYWKDYTKNLYLVGLDEVTPIKMYECLTAYLQRYLDDADVANWMPPKPWKYSYVEAAALCGAVVVDIVYETAAKQRRRALAHMLQLARSGTIYSPEYFRSKIISYLSSKD